MLAKKIKYVDFNGDTQEPTFMFHLSAADIIRLEIELSDSEIDVDVDDEKTALERLINSFVDAQNGSNIMAFFEKLILMSFGIKDPDGQFFDNKSQNTRDLAVKFTCSPAYDALLMELLGQENSAIEFFNGIIPISSSVNDNTKSNVSRN